MKARRIGLVSFFRRDYKWVEIVGFFKELYFRLLRDSWRLEELDCLLLPKRKFIKLSFS